MVVVVLEALPVCVELLQAVRVDVLDPGIVPIPRSANSLRSDICDVSEAGKTGHTRSQRNE